MGVIGAETTLSELVGIVNGRHTHSSQQGSENQYCNAYHTQRATWAMGCVGFRVGRFRLPAGAGGVTAQNIALKFRVAHISHTPGQLLDGDNIRPAGFPKNNCLPRWRIMTEGEVSAPLGAY